MPGVFLLEHEGVCECVGTRLRGSSYVQHIDWDLIRFPLNTTRELTSLVYNRVVMHDTARKRVLSREGSSKDYNRSVASVDQRTNLDHRCLSSSSVMHQRNKQPISRARLCTSTKKTMLRGRGFFAGTRHRRAARLVGRSGWVGLGSFRKKKNSQWELAGYYF